MKRRITLTAHLPAVLLVLAALACTHLDFEAAALTLFFAGAVHEVWLWLRAVQRPLRAGGRATITLRSPR